jgi:hypothetical protein
MEVKCECGNDHTFIEETVTKWYIDGEGNRERRAEDDVSRFFCPNCNQDGSVEILS